TSAQRRQLRALRRRRFHAGRWFARRRPWRGVFHCAISLLSPRHVLRGSVVPRSRSCSTPQRREGVSMVKSRYRAHSPRSEMNVVPYVDVMLVLLVLFMITLPALQVGIQVDLPRIAADPLDGS